MAIYKSANRATLKTTSPTFTLINGNLSRSLTSAQSSIVDSINLTQRDTPKDEFIVSASATTAESIFPALDAVLNAPLATVGGETLQNLATQAHIARIDGDKHALGATFRISARYTSRNAYKNGAVPVGVATAVVGKNGEIPNIMFGLASVLDDFANALFKTKTVSDELVAEFVATCQAVVAFNDAIHNPRADAEPVAPAPAPVADAPTAKPTRKAKTVADAPMLKI